MRCRSCTSTLVAACFIGSDRDTLRNHFAPCRDRKGYDNSYDFGSAHPSGVSMALCDGSVRHIPFNIDPTIHKAALLRGDGLIGN